MKRLILLCLLLLLLCSEAQAWMNPYIAGTGGTSAYCTGATTCTASTPGSCDLLCEDFEGNQHCVDNDTYDYSCRLEHRWTISMGTGQSGDFTTTHSGTFSACSDKGTNAYTYTSSTAGNSGYILSALSADAGSDVYIQFYININSLTLADTKKQGLTTSYYTGYNTLFYISILRTGSAYNLFASCNGCAATSTGSTDLASYLDGSTWLRIGIAAKQSDDTFTVYLNGSQEIQRTDYTSNGEFIGTAFGTSGGSAREATAAVVQYDNLAISKSALPGTCVP